VLGPTFEQLLRLNIRSKNLQRLFATKLLGMSEGNETSRFYFCYLLPGYFILNREDDCACNLRLTQAFISILRAD
jgi:hypothetical protein